MRNKTRKQYPNDFKTILGLNGMMIANVIASSFMSSYFLTYLTDYAGLGLVGATIAPIILTIGRIVDAVDDPLQGWIIDSAKPKKFGKYRFFCLISLLLTTLSICFLYSIPSGLASNVVLLFIYVLTFYILYDMGAALWAHHALVQKMDFTVGERAKVTMIGRFLAIFIGAVFSTFMMIVNAINSVVNNFGRSFSIATVLLGVVSLAISVVMLLLVKEKETQDEVLVAEKEEKVTFKDVINIFRVNKAFNVNFFGQLFRGFVYALLTSTTAYYMKYAYCIDENGIFNAQAYGTYNVLFMTVSMLPMLLAAAVSPVLMKKFDSSVKLMNLANGLTLVAGVVAFILQLLGVLNISFYIFAALMFILFFGNGLAFVPGTTLWMECMDYNTYKTGKPMSGSISALSAMLGKAQSAISTLFIGIVLALSHYEVDSKTGNYIGDLATLPSVLNWFVASCTIIPGVVALVSAIIFRFYPITPEVKAEMKAALEKKENPETEE